MTREEIVHDEATFIAQVAAALATGTLKGPAFAAIARMRESIDRLAIAVGDDREGVSKT